MKNTFIFFICTVFFVTGIYFLNHLYKTYPFIKFVPVCYNFVLSSTPAGSLHDMSGEVTGEFKEAFLRSVFPPDRHVRYVVAYDGKDIFITLEEWAALYMFWDVEGEFSGQKNRWSMTVNAVENLLTLRHKKPMYEIIKENPYKWSGDIDSENTYRGCAFLSRLILQGGDLN